MAGAALRLADAIAVEARGGEGVGSRGPGRRRVGLLVAAALLAGMALVALAALVGVRGGVSSARSSAVGAFARLPVPLRGLVSGTLGRSERVFWVRRAGAGFALMNGAQGFSARFSDSGVRVSARGGRLALSLAGVGYGSSLRPLRSRAPSADGNRVSYAYGALTQWYENGPFGLEQGFTLRAPPPPPPPAAAGAARGPLTIALRLAGSLRARLVDGGEAIDFIAPDGGVVLRYEGLRAIDARGRVLRAWLDATEGRLLVRVDTRGARYPLRIDPFVQQGSKLVGTGAAGDAGDVSSVALSSDGNTALVGGSGDNGGVGAAWVFTRSGTTWTQQGPKLVGTGAVGDASQGSSVALSSDGNTALVGGPEDDTVKPSEVAAYPDTVGAAWVFKRSGTTWTQQGPKLVGTGAVGDDAQGQSVALSSDGNTALVGGGGGRGDLVVGAAWVFTRSGTTWTQQGSNLVGTGAAGDADQGSSVALSGDGNTALVGGPLDNCTADIGCVGAVWVFTRSGTTWTQQGSKLVGTGAVGNADQGFSVAVSSDGDTALVGGPSDNGHSGAAWVFTRSGTTWTEQGAKLVGTGSNGHAYQGLSVALSGDGNTALVGGPNDGVTDVEGAVWVFTRSGTTWTQQAPKFVSTGGVGGSSVALSGDGNTALVGGGGIAGAAVFVMQQPVPPPVLGKSVDVAPVSGVVLLKRPGQRGFVRLRAGERVPVGSTLDTTRGVVSLTAAVNAKGKTTTGTFHAGEFRLTQKRARTAEETVLTLTGPKPTGCTAGMASAARRRPRKRRLWGSGSGHFRTVGSDASASELGTKWLTEDTCAGTLIRVTQGAVAVDDFPHHRTFVLRAPHSFLAHPRHRRPARP